MSEYLVDLMRANDAPSEQYERLGSAGLVIHRPSSATRLPPMTASKSDGWYEITVVTHDFDGVAVIVIAAANGIVRAPKQPPRAIALVKRVYDRLHIAQGIIPRRL